MKASRTNGLHVRGDFNPASSRSCQAHPDHWSQPPHALGFGHSVWFEVVHLACSRWATGGGGSARWALERRANRNTNMKITMNNIVIPVLARLMLLITAFLLCTPARTATIQVPGSADPWLAGMPDGTVASGTDHAPAQSPVEVSGMTVSPGVTFTFHVTGSVSRGAGDPLTPPDGNTDITSHLPPVGAENGISDITAPYECLVGVFLSSGQPDQHVAPQPLDFSSVTSRNFSVLTPTLQQVFFIGDGLNSTGEVQQFIAPVSSSRLFLGTLDRDGYYNNLGSFTVEVQGLRPLGSSCTRACGSRARLERVTASILSVSFQARQIGRR